MTQLNNSTTTILNAADATGAGSTFNVPPLWRELANGLTWEVVITGSPTTVSASLQGSLDNSNWYDLDTHTNVGNNIHAVDAPLPAYVRGYVATLSGGTTPTVTVKVMKGR